MNKLDSSWKQTPEGFTKYYEERKKRVEALEGGFVKFRLDHQIQGDGGSLTICVNDSGPGFEHESNINNNHKSEGYCGRGIPLIRTLCHSLRYIGNGNMVEAVFKWDADD